MTEKFVTLSRAVVEQIISAFDADLAISSGWQKKTAATLRASLEQHQQKASSSNDLPAETGDLSSSAKSRWKWVAVEPTKEMCQAGEIEMTTYGADVSPSGIYKAMLKVAPQQPYETVSEPDWSNSKTFPSEPWKNPLLKWQDRLRIVDSALWQTRNLADKLRVSAATAKKLPVVEQPQGEQEPGTRRVAFGRAVLERAFEKVQNGSEV